MSPNSGFPGFGDTAPLDIAEFSSATTEALIQRIADGSFDAWADTAARVGYCANPVRLVGSSNTVDAATGQVLDTFSSDQSPLGVVYRPCGNRRADVCPSCSRVYARDTFELIRWRRYQRKVDGPGGLSTSLTCRMPTGPRCWNSGDR